MRKHTILEKMKQAAYSDSKVMVYFKDTDRFPIAGWFIALDDFDGLSSKEMVRFVSVSKDNLFNESRTLSSKKEYTRLLDAENIFDIKTICHDKYEKLDLPGGHRTQSL